MGPLRRGGDLQRAGRGAQFRWASWVGRSWCFRPGGQPLAIGVAGGPGRQPLPASVSPPTSKGSLPVAPGSLRAWPPLLVHSPFSPPPCSVSKTAPPPLPPQHSQSWDWQVATCRPTGRRVAARSLLGACSGGTRCGAVLLSLLLPHTAPLAPPSPPCMAWGQPRGPPKQALSPLGGSVLSLTWEWHQLIEGDKRSRILSAHPWKAAVIIIIIVIIVTIISQDPVRRWKPHHSFEQGKCKTRN